MEVIVGLVLVVAFVFLIRAFGAWMLRIDDVIYYQKEILKEIRKYSENSTQTISPPKKNNNVCKNCGTLIQPNKTECPKCGLKSE